MDGGGVHVGDGPFDLLDIRTSLTVRILSHGTEESKCPPYLTEFDPFPFFSLQYESERG